MNYAAASNDPREGSLGNGFLAVLAAGETETHPAEPDLDFVRRCQAHACKGAPPFEAGERFCRRCGKARPRACARIQAIGGSPYEHALLRDAFDASFNGLNFVGCLKVRLTRVEAGTWSIDEAEVLVPACYDAKTIPATILVSAALKQAGIGVGMHGLATPAPIA